MDTVKHRVGLTQKFYTLLVRIFIYSAIPLLLTLLSVFYIRFVPTVFGNLCGPSGDDFCYKSLPQAGFPFAFWKDTGGISVMGHLGIEDDISGLAFAGDFLFYFLLLFAADTLINKCRNSKREG